MRVGIIGHGGLWRAFSFARPIRVLGISRGSTPRHAQTAREIAEESVNFIYLSSILSFNTQLESNKIW